MDFSARKANGADARTSSEDWARRLQRGDPNAVQIVRERVRKILAFHRLRIPRQDRDDLEQESMTEIWQAVNRSGFDFRAGFWGFVEVVTSRRCIDWLRARKKQSHVLESFRDEGRNPFERLLDEERAGIASRVLGALGPECREIILMRLHEGIPYKEIARILGKGEGALRVQMYRCIRDARNIIRKMDPGVQRVIEKGEPDGSS